MIQRWHLKVGYFIFMCGNSTAATKSTRNERASFKKACPHHPAPELYSKFWVALVPSLPPSSASETGLEGHFAEFSSIWLVLPDEA